MYVLVGLHLPTPVVAVKLLKFGVECLTTPEGKKQVKIFVIGYRVM